MDPFTQRMLERAKARREKLDTQLSNAGHDLKRRSPLRDANAIVLQAAKLAEAQVKEKPSKPEKIKEPVYKTPEKNKIPQEEKTPKKENESTASESGVKMKLQRLGKLYSDDSEDLSSPIHRTEEKFSADDDHEEGRVFKRVGSSRLDRLAALASTINNWEDDLSHPSLVKKSESKAEKIQAKMNEQVKIADNPQPSTSGHSRWKSNNPPGKQSSSPAKPLKLDRTVLQSLEPKEGQNSQEDVRSSSGRKDVHESIIKSSVGSPKSPLATKTPEKSGKNVTPSGSRNGNRFGGYTGSSKSTIQSSPGSVLSKASLFESKSIATKAKDPAEMTLSERMALFERNKGEALIPKAPLTLSVPTKKLLEPKKSSASSSSDQRKNESSNAVSQNRALFEHGLPRQELENDIVRESQAERQRELEMLRSRFNKNKEVAQAAAGSCIRPRNNSETHNGSPKNSPVCPVKPTPATDPVPPPPPPPPPPLPSESVEIRSSSAKRQVCGTPPSNSHLNPPSSVSSATKRIKMGDLYPDLADIRMSDTETSDTEYTVGTSEAETVTVTETETETETDTQTDTRDTEFFSQDDSYDDQIGNSSFESSVLKVVKEQQQQREQMNNKRQMETSDDESTSDISVLDEMDEYLDECLANQEMSGPTPPKKFNRANESPSVASNSFKYSHSTSPYRSPLIVTPAKSPKTKNHVIVEDNEEVPLMHSISFYRRQQSQTPKTPAKQIIRTVEVVRESSEDEEKREAILVQEKIKRLYEEINKQQTIIGQASQALNLCTSTIEFTHSREQVEGERLLLVATHRRQAALNEIQRLKVEGSLRPSIPGSSEVQESGSLTISAITLPLIRDHRDNDMCLHFLCLIRHLDTVVPTPVVQVEPGDSCIRFPSTIKLDDLYSDFKVTIEIYSLETRAEVLPHEIKYHITGNAKKSGYKTPKKHKYDPRMIIPPVQSPAGPSAVRTPSFNLTGYVVFSLKEVNRQQFTLNKVPKNSSLEGHLQMHVSCQLSVSIEHRGFLTMFDDVSGLGAWHRRWCLLKGDTLSYWKYPDDERKKTPIGTLELQGVVTTNVELVSRDICARANTFLLETVRPASAGDVESLVLVKNGSTTIIRHLLSADTKEERLDWCSKLNQTLNLIRAWGGNVSAYN